MAFNEFNYRWEAAVQIRTCPYLNNVVEQDHRRIKARVGPMLRFKRFFNARRVLAGIELVLIKGQFGLPESWPPYMYGITCSPREGCTYLQQIPLLVGRLMTSPWAPWSHTQNLGSDHLLFKDGASNCPEVPLHE